MLPAAAMPTPFVVLSLGRTSRYVFSAHARGVASCCSATFRLTHPRRRRPRWSRSPSFSLVLERFLKNRNCEPRFLQRNRFIYCIKAPKEPESELERNRNHLSTKREIDTLDGRIPCESPSGIQGPPSPRPAEKREYLQSALARLNEKKGFLTLG